jgi:hypothetical protein
MPKISNDTLQKYFGSGGSYYPLYDDSVKLYNALRIHADGEFPGDMIRNRRPSETDEILAYRELTYKPITKLPISKVINSLSKIRRSPDWAINFPTDTIPAKIIESETLEEYCNNNLPGYTSITNWIFGLLLKQNAIDANAIVAVIPKETLTANEYSKPVPIVFNSDQIMAYDEHYKYCILKSKVTVTYEVDSTNVKTGERYYYIDDHEFIIYDENKDGFNIVFQQPIPFGEMPVWKLHAEAYKQYDNMSLNKSRIETMATFLDEAACEYSDLKGSKIQHLFPLFWYFQNKDCVACKGTGKIASASGDKTCITCSGDGKIKFSPFAHIQLQPPSIGQTQVPAPPAGYIEKDTAILELQDKSVDKQLFKSLSAVNMQFLDQTPLSISGDAKRVDHEELDNFVHNFAEDIVYTSDRSIYFINEWRYSYIVPDKEARKAMLPEIPVPEKFDLLPEEYLVKEITDAKAATVNPLIIAALEEQLAAKKFYNDPELAGNVKLFFDLNPLPGISIDEKMSLKSNNAITEEDFIISTYMAQFIKRALREDKDFAAKPYDAQMDLLKKYAQEKIAINNAAGSVVDEAKKKVLEEMNNNAGA